MPVWPRRPSLCWLDTVSTTTIAGWALDPDFAGPVMIHIYVDGNLFDAIPANNFRPDVGAHAFHYTFASLGNGNHTVAAYVIGTNSAGQPDGENMGLTGSPKQMTASCSEIPQNQATHEWCRSNGEYFQNRQMDTTRLLNDKVLVGVNNSYGGMIGQLYSSDRSFNLIQEHGGAALQLSLWGYGNHNDGTTCNTIPDFATHPLDAPWNPIQAQADNCGWTGPANDVTSRQWVGNTYRVIKQNPYNFTKTGPFRGLTWAQDVTLGDAHARIDYATNYAGSFLTGPTLQEVPALYTGIGMNAKYMYADAGGNVITRDFPTVQAGQTMLPRPTEGWWSACDSSGTHCLTVATASPDIQTVRIRRPAEGDFGDITPIGCFSMTTNTSLTLYVFPYRYDAIINNVSVRNRIAQLIGRPTEAKAYPHRDCGPFPG